MRLRNELVKIINEQLQLLVNQIVHKISINTMEDYNTACARVIIYEELIKTINSISNKIEREEYGCKEGQDENGRI